MNEKIFIVTYKAFVSEGDIRAGWAGYREFERVIHGEKEMVKWMAGVEAWNDPKLRNDPKEVIKVEEVGKLVDVTSEMVNAGKVEKEDNEMQQRTRRAAALRAEARKIERGY